jgi:hypothetical protein
MATTLYRETAKIYEFPVKSRVASGRIIRQRSDVAQVSRITPRTEFGSGWYHDDAIARDEAKSVN